MRPSKKSAFGLSANSRKPTASREMLWTFSPLLVVTLILAATLYAAFTHLGNAAYELTEREYQNQQTLIARQAAERLDDLLSAVDKQLEMSSAPADRSDFRLSGAPVEVTVATLEEGETPEPWPEALTLEREVGGLRLRAQLDPALVYDALFASLGRSFDAYVWVMDSDRVIVASPDPAQVGTRPFEALSNEEFEGLPEVLEAMVAGESGVGRYQWQDGDRSRTRLIAYTPVPDHELAVAYSADRSAVLALTQELHATQALWLTLFLGALFVVSGFLIFRAVRRYRERLAAASRLGPYSLGERLGEGGMGVVFEATHALLRRPTAIKLMHGELSSPATLKRFEREVQMTARLTHPNTVTVFDYGQTEAGVFYYAMELIDGPTLWQVVETTGALPEARVVHLMKQVAGALAEAHEAGLIHRDIKPANIMICKRGGVFDVAKVLDFGLVREVGETGGRIAGTPEYMAPETFVDVSKVGERSDVYAMGAVAYFLVTGRAVFEGTSTSELAAQHTLEEPAAPSERAPNGVLDPALEALILRCLAKDPAERPETARALLNELCSLSGEWTQSDAEAVWFKRPVHVGNEAPTESATELGLARTRELL